MLNDKPRHTGAEIIRTADVDKLVPDSADQVPKIPVGGGPHAWVGNLVRLLFALAAVISAVSHLLGTLGG